MKKDSKEPAFGKGHTLAGGDDKVIEHAYVHQGQRVPARTLAWATVHGPLLPDQQVLPGCGDPTDRQRTDVTGVRQ